MELRHYIDAFSSLHTAKVKGRKAPHAFAYAEIDEMLFQLLQNADARAMLRVILINTYLANQPTKTMPNLNSLIAALPLIGSDPMRGTY